MKINLEFMGLEELMKGVEMAGDDSEIRELNKSIISQVQPHAVKAMESRMPRSKDISKSGRGWGTQRPVTAHAADSIPVQKVRAHNQTGARGSVGWENIQDAGDYFYVKFINWGTLLQPPQEFVFSAGREVDGILKGIAEKEYQAFLLKKIG